MIRHIVAFRLNAEDPASRAEHVRLMREALEPLASLEMVRSITVRADLGLIDGHWHAVLVSEHDSNAALEAYQLHPEHQRASAIAGQYVADRAAIDYEF